MSLTSCSLKCRYFEFPKEHLETVLRSRRRMSAGQVGLCLKSFLCWLVKNLFVNSAGSHDEYSEKSTYRMEKKIGGYRWCGILYCS